MCNSNLSIIRYNRKSKEYEIEHNGVIFATFPNSPENKQAAIQEAIKHDDPQAHAAAFYLHFDLFRNRPDLHPRIWKAARIVSAGGVFAPHILETRSKTAGYVASQSSGEFYNIQKWGNAYECDCFDFHNNAPKVEHQTLCKHIIAYKLMKIINRELTEFAESPHKIIKHLNLTGASFHVVGAVNGRFYTYTTPQTRKAAKGEIIEREGKLFRISANHNGQRLILEPFHTNQGQLDIYEETRRATGLPGRFNIRSKERTLKERLEQHMNQAEAKMMKAGIKLFN